MIEICNLRKQKPKEIYDVKVDRTSVLGNPFFMKSEAQRDEVCDKYETYFKNKIKTDYVFINELNNLVKLYEEYGNLRLFCWCSPKRCHAETIKKWLEETMGI